MSKLIFSLISRNLVNKPNLLARVLPTSRKILVIANNNQLRRLASSSNNQVTKSTEKTPIKSSESVNEFDKPQWERSDRFVGFVLLLLFFLFRVVNNKNKLSWMYKIFNDYNNVISMSKS